MRPMTLCQDKYLESMRCISRNGQRSIEFPHFLLDYIFTIDGLISDNAI